MYTFTAAPCTRCTEGLTMTLKLQFTALEEGAQVFSSGGDDEENTGMSISFIFGRLQVSS